MMTNRLRDIVPPVFSFQDSIFVSGLVGFIGGVSQVLKDHQNEDLVLQPDSRQRTSYFYRIFS